MTRVELRFLANRYHGTGWGRHVNEGVAEWPPSPYRLLRAMFDVWKRKCPELKETEVKSLFTLLGSELPTFWLPKAASAHTRSYLSSNTEDRSDKSLIFDAYVAFHAEAVCIVEWNFDLDENQQRLLQRLLSGLNYLGRSESWIEARLGGEPELHAFISVPYSGQSDDDELVYLACLVPPMVYGGKRSWFEALTYSTSDLLKERLSGPPAMKLVPYQIPRDAVTTWLPTRQVSPKKNISAAVVELHARVLPMATDSIRVAERVRGRLMRLFEDMEVAIPPVIHGKDHNGKPLTCHTHLFILPRANKAGRIDNVLLFTKRESGFPAEVISAITKIHSLHWFDLLRVTTAWMGRYDDAGFRPKVRTVISATPFVTVRHWREGRGTPLDFLKDELRRECRNHGIKEPIGIDVVDTAGRFAPAKFRRNREDDPVRPGSAFRLHFNDPVQAPFALGYGCHFGLGQFEPARS